MPVKISSAATNAAGRKVLNRFALLALVCNVLCSICLLLTPYFIKIPLLSQRASLPRDNFFLTLRYEQQSCGCLPELIRLLLALLASALSTCKSISLQHRGHAARMIAVVC